MDKLLKSIFGGSDKKKMHRREEEEIDKDFTPPLDDRRKLSISRSGRMKQANKKRHSLNMDVYGNRDHVIEKPKSLEYHVNNPKTGSANQRRHSGDPNAKTVDQNDKNNTQKKTPEEEIDSAFEIIDKIS